MRAVKFVPLSSAPLLGGRLPLAMLLILGVVAAHQARAVPSFARQTGMPCSQCHTLSFGPALTEYGRQFKLNGYVWGDADSKVPIALMLQGGYSRSDAAQPSAPVPGYSPNNNVSLDQASLFLGSRISEHLGIFAQGTYSGEQRLAHWDNTDVRYARPVSIVGTDAVVGISINNNPTVQDLWNSTPAWGYPYINSPLVPVPGANPIVSGALAQYVLGATAYAMIHDHYYIEAGAYRGVSNKWLGNLGVNAASAYVSGAAPYWRAAYQFKRGEAHYFSIGTFGLDVREQPDPTVPDKNRYTDFGFDASYQFSGTDGSGVLVNASYTHEKQDLTAFLDAQAAANRSNHLNALRLDASYAYRQTWSAGVGLFEVTGGSDTTLYAPNPLTGSNNGSPDSSGYILQLECVPLGKMASWGRPWVNIRVGVQYTGYLKYNGGTTNYDGFGRSASQNNSLFLFSWMAF